MRHAVTVASQRRAGRLTWTSVKPKSSPLSWIIS